MHDDEKFLHEMTKEGKTISITIKIHDQDKAKKLMSTMYGTTMHGENMEDLGVEVMNWGFCDIMKAEGIRLNKLKSEIESFNANISNIICESATQILREDEETA